MRHVIAIAAICGCAAVMSCVKSESGDTTTVSDFRITGVTGWTETYYNEYAANELFDEIDGGADLYEDNGLIQ